MKLIMSIEWEVF